MDWLEKWKQLQCKELLLTSSDLSISIFQSNPQNVRFQILNGKKVHNYIVVHQIEIYHIVHHIRLDQDLFSRDGKYLDITQTEVIFTVRWKQHKSHDRHD